MAIYQFSFNFETKITLLETKKLIAKYFKKNHHWNKDVILYGELDTTCFEIENNEINVRLDISNITKELMIEIDHILVVLTDYFIVEGVYYSYSMEKLIALIRLSAAFKFCSEPKTFLDNI